MTETNLTDLEIRVIHWHMESESWEGRHQSICRLCAVLMFLVIAEGAVLVALVCK
jgi:hypothetical protein